MKKLIDVLLPVFMMILITGCGDIKVRKESKEYIGNNYKEVVQELEQLGFSDIETIEIADLTSYGEMSDGAISEISIDENTEFSANTAFSKDAKIIVTYHIVKKLPLPIMFDQITSMDYVEVADSFADAGFTNVKTEELYDLDPDEIDEEYQNEIKIDDITLLADSDVIPFDANINIICHYPYEKYDVQFNVDFIGNLFFNKYDVDFSIDGDKQDTLNHGKDWEKAIRLKEGEHTITFSENGDSTVNGEVLLDIASNVEVEYEIYCYENKITVETIYLDREMELADNEVKVLCTESNYLNKNYKSIKNELTELGFKNIKTVPDYDIIWGITEKESVKSIFINGLDDFKRGDVFLNDVEVIITYHMPYEDDPENQVVEEEIGNNNSDEKLSVEDSKSDYNQGKTIYDHDAEVLDEYNAWNAVEEYGKSKYKEFDLHSMTGVLSAEQEDDNTWKLKALCDIDTGNGELKNCNCEATVEGTNLDARVTYFYVY